MAELESLVFSVDTTQLDGAQKKVDALATSVAGLEQATTGLSNAEANAIRTAAEITKAKAELTRANNALAKAEESAAKATEASTKALESNSKPIEQSTEKTSKLDKLLQNLANTHKDLTEGFSRSESSTLNMARSFGASADYIEKIQNQLKDIGKLTKNPFDASLGAIRSITNELEAMSNRAKLADKALFMTSKQLAEYSRITTEAEGKVIAAGFDPKSVEGLAKVNEIADKSRAIYEEKAKALNSLVAAEERSNNEARKTLELQANLNRSNNEAVDTLQRLSKITEMVNSGMSKQEAEYRLANASKGISKELTDNLIAAEKSLNIAIENQVKAKKAEEQQYKNSNSMMDAATQQYYKEKAAIESRNSAIRAGSAAMVDYVANLQQRTQRDTIAEKYVGQGASRATANLAAKSEMQGVPQADIDSFVKQASAMDMAVKKKTELANASKTLIDIEQRLAAALSQSNDGLNQQATDTLVKYQNALKATGASAEVTAAKMAALKNQLDQVAAKERAQQLQHLARAISVQMGDIGVSLASGQNPLIVMIQQGDQIRGALEQAGAKGKELQVAMNNAAGTIATGFKNTALAVGGFAVGAMTKLKDSFVNVIPAALEYNKTLQIIRSSESTFADKRNFITARKELYATLPALATTAAVAILAVASAINQTIDAEKELTRTLILNGASLGVTNKELFAYAEGMKIAGASSNAVKLAMSEIITSGVQLKDSLLGITQVAIDLERYLGVAISATAKQYADLAKDPVKSLAEFATSTGLINVETLQLVDSLVEMGDKTKAVTVATEALKNAQVEMVNAAKAEMTPLAVLWDNIKIAIQGVWQSTIDLGTSTPVITSLQTVWALLYSAISGVITAIKTAGAAIIGLSSISGKLLSFDLQGAKQELTDFNTVLAGIGGDYIKGIQGAMGFKDAVTTSSAKVLKANSDNAASFEAVRKTMKRVEDQSDKLDKKTDTKPEYIKKYLEDQLKYAQAQMKTGQEVRFTTEQLKKQEEVAGRLWEKEQKKKRAPREKLNRPSNVDLQENKKSYESAIRLAEEFGKNERAILKNNYEAGLVERGAYIARDLALIIAGEQQRRQAIEAETAGLTQDYEKKRTALEAEAKRIKSSTLKGAPEQYQKVERALSDLSKQQETFNVLQGDKTAKLENEINLRYSETLKESNLVMVALNKSYTDFVKKQDDLATQRKDQIAFANTLMQLTGAEAAAYKAGAESVKQMTDELSKFKNDAKEADKVFSDFIANTKPSDFDNEAFLQRYILLLKQKQNAATKVDEAIAKSGEYVEKAKTDAVTMYYQEEVKRISEGLSGVLTTAIFDGGEAGAKALRSFIEQELRKKFMIEIQANLVTPLVNQAFGALGIDTKAGGSSGLAGGVQTASNLNSLWGTASQAIFGGTAGASAASLVGANAVGMLGGDAIGTLAAANGMWAGVATGAQATAQAAIAANVALEAGTAVALEAGTLATASGAAGAATAGAASSLTSAIAAIPGWGWALAGVALLAGSGVFDGGETRSGGRYTTTNEGVKFNEGPSGGAINRYTEEQLNKQAFININNFLRNIGSKDFLTQFVSGIETSDNGKGGAFAGGTLSSGAKFGDTQSASAYQFNENLSADDAMKRYTEEMNKVTIAALQAATDVPEYIAKAIAGLDVEKMTAEQADAVVKDVQEMFTAMKTANKYMRDFGATLFEATEKGALSLSLLTSEFGGLEQFNSAMQTFSSLVSSPFQQALSNYTELRTAIDDLGIELPYSAEGIRQLTNGLDLNTEAGRKVYASMIQAGSAMIQAGDALLETIGTSTEELAGIIVEGMRKGDPAGAGQYFADTVVYGIENALYQNMGSQITQIITNGIITPLMQSMFAGSTAAEAISKLSIASVTKQVQEVTTFFSSLFSSSEWKSVMSSLQQGLSGLVSSTITSMPAPTFSEPVNPWKEVDKAAKDAEDAAKKAAEEWAKLLETLNDRKRTAEIKTIYLTQGKAAGVAAERAKELSELTKDLNSKQTQQITALYGAIVALEDYNATLEAVQKLQEEGKTLEIQLLRALGKEELALSKERAIAIKDMSELEIAQYDLNTSTSKLIDQVTNLNSVFKSVFDTLATPDMKATKSYQDALAGIEKETGVKMDRRYVQNFTNEELLNIVGVVSQWKDVSAETRANLIGFVGQIGELNTAFRETEKEIKSLVVTLSERFMSKQQLGASKYDTLASDIISSNLSGAEKNSLSRALQDANKQTIQDTLLDLFNNDLTQDQKKSLVEIANKLLDYLQQALDDAMSETDKAFSTLTAIADKQIAKLEKSFEVTDNAYAALERAVEAQRKGLEKQIKTAEKTRDTLKEIFDFLTEQIRELRGEVDQTKKMQAEEGRRIILEARASGVLPTEKILQESVGAARTGVEDQLYATKQERDRAYLVLANDLEALKNIAGPQLTEAEKQLEIATKQLDGLDDILKKAKDQIDIMRGIDVSNLSIDQAMSNLQTAIQAEQVARDQIKYIKNQIELAQAQYDTLREVNQGVTDLGVALTNFATTLSNEMKAIAATKSILPNQSVPITTGIVGGTQGPVQPSIGAAGSVVPFTPTSTTAVSSNGTPSQTIVSNPGMGTIMYQPTTPSAPVSPSAPTNYFGSNGAEVHVASGVGYQAGTGLPYVVSEIASLASSMLASGQDQAVIAAIQGQGFTHSQAEAILGMDLPQFAVGTNYVTQDMVAKVHEGEMIVPKAFNPVTAGFQQDNSDLVEELQALRQEVQMLRSEARATALNTGKLDRRFDRMTAITPNGESLRTSDTPEG